MDTLPHDSELVGYPLESPTLLLQSGDVWVLSGIDLRVRVRMFEEEPTPVVPARKIPKRSGGKPPDLLYLAWAESLPPHPIFDLV